MPPTLKQTDILDCIDPNFNTFVKLPRDLFPEVSSIAEAVKICQSRKRLRLIEIPGNINDLIYSIKYGPIAVLFSTDLTMVSGIEKKISENISIIPSLTRSELELGKVVNVPYKKQHVYCMFTRKHWWERSSYSALLTCLKRLLIRVLRNKQKYVFIPRLGCGVDGLDWEDVKSMIKFVFGRTKVQIIALSMRSDKKTLMTEIKPKRRPRTKKTLYTTNNELKWFTNITKK
ncbi:O-acetyl-ADP-ribose deacetylase 1 [Thelohanellus kitauei]|uniref:O-acetyl-ADP-ribose deacetylase 1 n=1 Tax=Thelohanellus kitauei TaxID=669202 RepID=A0A0C2JAT1_THEKT|nr:O-acetyl-ADP-ribose deacetylase 1 [Thelohanellus kitauei]